MTTSEASKIVVCCRYLKYMYCTREGIGKFQCDKNSEVSRYEEQLKIALTSYIKYCTNVLLNSISEYKV